MSIMFVKKKAATIKYSQLEIDVMKKAYLLCVLHARIMFRYPVEWSLSKYVTVAFRMWYIQFY